MKPKQPFKGNSQKQSGSKNLFLYGKHTCIAALKNNKRKILKLFITKNFDVTELPAKLSLKPEILSPQAISNLVPEGSVHQGIVIETIPLAELGIDYIEKKGGIIIILDQITDPQNIGTILRTAAAFNVTAIIIPKDNAPKESVALAKAASGALEITPLIKVTNLVRTILDLKKHGYWFIGMDSHTETAIGKIQNISKNTALVMGAEGKGLRRLTRDSCDFIVKIPINIESLNVSAAAAIGLYCLSNCQEDNIS